MNKKLKNRIKVLAVTTVVVAQVLFFSSSLIGSLNAETIDVSQQAVVDGNEVAVVDESAPVVSKTSENLSVEEATEAELTEAVVSPVVDSEVVVEPIVETTVVDEEVTETSATNEATVNAVTVTPELSTGKDDYHPGETATIFGKFFDPLQNIILKIFGSDENDQNYTESFQSITTDSLGSFATQYQLDNLYRPFYWVTALSLENQELAKIYFRDSSIQKYDQCSNDAGTGYVSGDTGCRWINGAIGPTNSSYPEGDSTVQRIWLTGLAPNSTHTIRLQYGTTKAGKHAYDFLTRWDWSENWVTVADRCQDVAGCTTASEDESITIPHDSNIPVGWEAAQGPGARSFVIRGGAFSGPEVGTPTLASGDYTGDSETTVLVTFTTGPASGSMCDTKQGITSCDAVIWFGAHVAKSLNWIVYDDSTGAGTISGNPYHVALDQMDGTAIGQRDNQMKATTLFGTINIVKDAVPDSAQDFNFQLATQDQSTIAPFILDDDADPTRSNTKSFLSIPTGNYTVSELNIPAGWLLTNIVCVDPSNNSSVNIGTGIATLALGSNETITCTFTNTPPQGHIIVDKVTIPSGQSQSFTFNTTGSGYNGFSLTDAAAPNDQTLNAGTYSVSEVVPAGWDQTSATCDQGQTPSNINLAAGMTVRCTFTNTLQQAHLTLLKTVVNDNGGTALDTAWTLAASGPTPISGVEGNAAVTNAAVNSGVYNLSESGGPTGYTASNYSCVNNGGAPVVSNSITLAPGDNATCTITNDDNAPSLTLVKVVENNNGGTATPADFTLTATGPTGFSGAGPSVSNGASFDAGVYALSESAVTGYTASNWVCVGGTQNGSNVTVGLGESATCTITNDDNAPTLKLVKVVTNNNGGTATPASWTLTATGSGGFSDAGNSTTFHPVIAGVGYALSESVVAGYAAGSWSCDVGSLVGSTVTLSLGQNATCTITNDDQAAHLIIIKEVINDNGGTKTAGDFGGNISGVTAEGGNTWTGTVAPGVDKTLSTVGAYNVTENADADYTTTYSADCTGTIALGETKTCTVTNNDKPAHLIVIKHVINDNGGTATASDFTMEIGGVTATGGNSFAGAEAPGTDKTLTTVGAYNVTESGPTGYTASFSEDCTGTIAIGQTKTCTITNDDNAPVLHLRKIVTNNNGGTATTADFTLTADGAGQNDISGTSPVDSGAGLLAGTFALSETSLAGYTASDWVCAGGNQDGASITLGLGEEATCTITNDDIQPTLTLVKTVVNDDGGTKQVSDFALFVNGNSVTSGVVNNLNAGVYTASETQLTGYTASVWGGDCAEDGSVTLAVGQNKTCTITNDDVAPKLTLVKVVINDNGGTKQVSDFPLFVNGNGVTSGVKNTLAANVLYTASETSVAGYTASVWSGDCSENGTITLQPGDDKTCTITNDDQTGHLIVHKVTVPAENQNVFSVTLDAAPVTGSATRDLSTIAPVNYEVNAGTYSVTETPEAGWDETANTCVGVVIANGETKECTITNTQRGHVIIKKNAIPDGSQSFTFNNDFGNGNAATFNLVDDSTPGLPSFDAEVLPGEYAVSEDAVAGWQLDSATCDNGETIESIDVAAGETVTCTFTNEKLAKITLVKNTVGGNDTFDFVMTGETLPASAQLITVEGTANQVFSNLDPDNTYSIDETPIPAGWAETSAVCDNEDPVTAITPNAGEEITCTFTNNKPAAQIDLTPLTATNKVGDDHVISANVQVHNGDGSWGPAVDGTVVTFSITNTGGATASFVGGDTCVTAAGACSITINSPTAGNVAVHATASPVVLGVSVEVATDGLGDNSADAGKDYVNARISITPNQDTNEVSDDHDFVVKVEQSVADGVWTPVPAGTLANAIVSPTPDGGLNVADCNDGVNASGECTVTINSSVAGIFTITARSTVNVGGVEFKLQTNGVGENSEPAVKTYVDAKISINPPSAVNEVGDAHVLTATVMEDDGAGFDPAVGETVTFTVTSGSATFVGGVNTCVTNGSGECTVSIESNDVGDNTIKAVSDVGVASLVLHRETDSTHGSTGPAVKKYVDAYITIGDTATNNITEEHVFTVTVTQVPGTTTPALTADVTPSVLPAPDSYSTTCDSSVDFVGNVATCTITINNNTPDVFTATASASMTIGGVSLTRSTDGTAPNSGSAIKTYVAGALEVTKVVDFGSVINPTAINDTFTVTVTGPSYPGGHDIVFTVLNGVLQAPTSVTLDPIIPGDYTITEADAGTEWTETVPAGAVTVVASQTAQAEVTNTYVPGSLEISKVVNLNGYLLPDGVDLDFTVNVTGPSYPAPHAVVFNVVNGVVTNSPQTLNNLIPGAYTVTEVDPGIAWTVSGNGNVDVVSAQTATKTITNDLKTPHTTITLTPDVFETLPGGNVILTITDTNDGQVPITNPSVELFANGVLTVPQPTYVSGDTNTNGIMDVGETWTWTVSVTINVETVFVVNGIGTDPLGNPVNGPTYSTETASQTVKVVGATRTIGFWQTHTGFTSYVFGLPSMQNYVGFNGTSSVSTHKGIITNTQSTGQSQLFGAFYAPIAKTTTGAKRTQIDQARIQMLQQLVAAKLNCAAFGCSAATLQLIADADAAYLAGANKNTIIALAGQLDAYNNSGDDIAIDPSLPPTGKATPKTSQGYANLGFWNTP